MILGTLASIAQGINGKWQTSIEGPNGKVEITYNLKVDGIVLTGFISSEMGNMAISNGKVDGKEFSFDIDFNGNTMPFKGTEDGDVIKIKMVGEPDGAPDGGNGPGEIILKRTVENN